MSESLLLISEPKSCIKSVMPCDCVMRSGGGGAAEFEFWDGNFIKGSSCKR
jgi:hypothetical protein